MNPQTRKEQQLNFIGNLYRLYRQYINFINGEIETGFWPC